MPTVVALACVVGICGFWILFGFQKKVYLVVGSQDVLVMHLSQVQARWITRHGTTSFKTRMHLT